MFSFSTIFCLHRTVQLLKVRLCRVRHLSMSFQNDKAYINGQWISARSGLTFPVINPANGEVIGNVADCDVEDTEYAIHSAKCAFKMWSERSAKERSDYLKKLFELQMKNSKEMAYLLTAEAGKPLFESVGEIKYGASFLEWFAEEARRIYGDVVPAPFTDRQAIFIKQAIGVAGIITPWNFPNAMITRKIGAALAAGCTCVIKPAEDTPLSALALAQLVEEANLPAGVVNVVTSSRKNTPAIGKKLCESPDVATISFTGSTAVGKLLLEQSASTVKRVSLELGGNAPSIIFNSANIQKAVAGVMCSKFRNSGQTCVCTNRILVQSRVHDQFIAQLFEAMEKQLIIGNGHDDGVTIGPLINSKAVEKVNKHVDDALNKGGKVLQGGRKSEFGENFFKPTLITNVNKDMLVWKEETFGPVAAVLKFDTEAEAVNLANDTRMGLAGYFYSEDYSQVWRVAQQLEVGMVGVNEGVISMAEAAFGGIKESGIGREGSKYGVDEYLNIKYICFGGLGE